MATRSHDLPAPSRHAGASEERGRSADRPQEIPRKGWVEVAKRVKDEAKDDNVALLAAGVAFYALLALVPALAALVSIYGLVADPADIDRQVDDVLAAAPAEVRELVGQQMAAVTEQSTGGLGLTAVIGIVLALWSASSGMKHMMTAVNVAYDEEESRGFLALRSRALLLTVGAVGFVAVAVGVITAVPALLDDTSLGGPAQTIIGILRFPVLGLGLVAGLAVLYRYAPDRDEPRWAWTAPGTIAATVLWLVASVLFSLYTSTMGSYAETYGALGAVVVLMLWLMLSAAAVVIGAEINAEAEKETVRDSTRDAIEPSASATPWLLTPWRTDPAGPGAPPPAPRPGRQPVPRRRGRAHIRTARPGQRPADVDGAGRRLRRLRGSRTPHRPPRRTGGRGRLGGGRRRPEALVREVPTGRRPSHDACVPLGSRRHRNRFAVAAAMEWPAAGALAGAASLVVSTSRVRDGQHHLLDVAGGIVLGSAVAALVRGAALRLPMLHTGSSAAVASTRP